MAWWLGWSRTPAGVPPVPIDDGVTLVDEHVLLIRRPARKDPTTRPCL